MNHLHLAYTDDTLDARCAVAIVHLWAAPKGTRIHHYPFRPADADGQTATLDARIRHRLYPPRQQPELEALVPVHEPSHHQILILGNHGLAADEDDAVRLLGAVTYVNGWTDQALCEATWQRFFPHRPAPLCVSLLGRYAMSYDKDHLMWTGEILPFQFAMRSVETDPTLEDGAEEWGKLMSSLTSPHTRKRITEGNTILRYLTMACGQPLERPSDGTPISRMRDFLRRHHATMTVTLAPDDPATLYRKPGAYGQDDDTQECHADDVTAPDSLPDAFAGQEADDDASDQVDSTVKRAQLTCDECIHCVGDAEHPDGAVCRHFDLAVTRADTGCCEFTAQNSAGE